MKDVLLKRWQALSEKHKGAALAAAFCLPVMAFLMFCCGSPEGEKVAIVVMRKAVKEASPLQSSDLGIREFPKKYLPKGYIAAKNAHLLVHRSLRIPLEQGASLRWVDFYQGDEDPNQLSMNIPEGYRAVGFSFGENSLETFLTPGDHIDVLGHFQRQGNRELTQTLFQNIKVLKTRPQLVLLLKPEEAELLFFAKQKGALNIILRQRGDAEPWEKSNAIDFDKVLGLKRGQTLARGPGQILTLRKVKPE